MGTSALGGGGESAGVQPLWAHLGECCLANKGHAGLAGLEHSLSSAGAQRKLSPPTPAKIH